MAKHDINVPKNMLLYPRIGIVRRVDDKKRMGRLWVWIPEFTSLKDDEHGWILCSYCSPFAGSTSREDTSADSMEAFESTQQSYGFWAVPPDIGNEVIVIFPSGHIKHAVWIGALYKEFGNKMVPGVPADGNNFVTNGKNLPIAEYNKNRSDVADPMDITRPGHTTRIDGISNQGLINDPVRGLTTSSAQRESPSEVFGILTPGARDPDSNKRMGGSSFVMDDAIGSEHITLMTKSGAKIKIDETNEMIYIINKPGTAWVQLDKEGNVDIFGAQSISMRAQKNINLRADGDINIEAGNNVNIKAAKDSKDGEIVGEGEGSGGIVVIEAHKDVEILAVTGNVRETAANGDVVSFAKHNIKTTSELDTLITSETAIIAQAKSDIRLTSTEESFTLFAAKNLKGSAGVDLTLTATGSMGLTSSTLDILSTGFQLDAKGSITNLGNIFTTGECSAKEYTSVGGSISFGSVKTHAHAVTGHNTAAATTYSGTATKPAVPVPAIPVPLAEIDPASPAETLAKVGKLNMLFEFEDEEKYNRKSAMVSTIVDRFITFEPCPEHSDFTIPDSGTTISGSAIPGASLASVMSTLSTAATPPLTLDAVRKELIAKTGAATDIGSLVKASLEKGGNNG